MRVYTGSGLHGDKNPLSCVHQCIMICWIETPSTPPFIGLSGRVYKEDPVGYYLSHPVLGPKPDAHRMSAQDQVVIHTARM
jgi:hypothetical protein